VAIVKPPRLQGFDVLSGEHRAEAPLALRVGLETCLVPLTMKATFLLPHLRRRSRSCSSRRRLTAHRRSSRTPPAHARN
jgi:hypothetical protein